VRKSKSKNLEYIYFKDHLLAIIIRSEYSSEGIEFFTPNDFSQQIGYMKRPTGYKIKPHVHNKLKRIVEYTKEVLYIKKGIVRVDFYTENQNYIKSNLLKKGDFILLAFGGHGLEIIEEAEIIEVKQGPFAGDNDKTRFENDKNETFIFN